MANFRLPLLLLPLLILGIKGEFLYTAVGPLNIRPNSEYLVTTTVSKLEKPVTFTFEISNEKNETIAKSEVILDTEGGQKVVSLPVKKLLDEKFNLTVKATDDGGKTFSEDLMQLVKETKNSALIVQTDKPIYKPGEMVKFRVFVLDRFFLPLGSGNDKKVEVSVYDTQRNVIKRWQALEVQGRKGFASGEVELSPEPNLGDWTIEVKLTEGADQDVQTHRFSVDQYVLPKYKVDLKFSPSFLTYNDSQVNAEISAIYSYGKPVSGKCTLTLSEPGRYYGGYGGNNMMGISSVVKTVHLDDKGVSNVRFDVAKELNVVQSEVTRWGKSFNVFATCTDKASGNVKNATSTLTMYEFPYKLSMVSRTDNIKPGFPVNITLKLSTQDDQPLGDKRPDALKIQHGFDASSEGGVLLTSVPDNGIVSLSFMAYTNPKICYESIDVSYKGLKENFWLPSKSISPSGSYIQVTRASPDAKIQEGDSVGLLVKSSKPFKILNILILSRGLVIHSEILSYPSTKETPVNIQLPPKSSPTVKILLYTTFEDKDLIVDSLSVDVLPSLENQLEISLSDKVLEPGENVSITLKGFKNSIVGLRAVDQSVLELKQDNDITQEKLGSIANSFSDPNSLVRIYGGDEQFQKFNGLGLGILTNANIEKAQRVFYKPAMEFSSFGGAGIKHKVQNSAEFAYDLAPVRLAQAPMAPPGAGGVAGGGAAAPPRVRSFFPESWIFEEVESPEGSVTVTKVVPDTITSWFINAFQLNQEHGLGLTGMSPKLTVFRPFFIVLNLPYSMVKGEVLGLQVLVHNYMESPVEASVTLENGDQFFKFLESESPTLDSQMTKTVMVNASGISTVVFPISPVKFGTMSLKVKATTAEAGDAVSQPLIVLPPGLKHTQNSAVFVNLLDSDEFVAKNLTAVFPEQRVPMADSLKVSVIGDILGGTINNLDKLIRLPRGCGEQNMVNFVPNVVILDYLNATGGLTEEIKRKTVGFLEKGYQRQLTYSRHDGSFSAFGKDDKTGSTWLTAFVTRAFIQAQKYITIDDMVVQRSLRFLIRQQNDNGSFAEEGFVYDKNLQGGAGTGANLRSLTAYVLLTFADAKKANIDLSSLYVHSMQPMQFGNQSILDRGVSYLLNNTNPSELRNPYEANLISYLLHYIDHPQKDSFFKAIDDMKRTNEQEGSVHWELKMKATPSPSFRVWPWQPRVQPATVEITSYGLLTYLLRGQDKLTEVMPIVRWLILNRNAEGGFYATQDTVMGITALGKFAEKLDARGNNDKNVKVEVSYEGGSHTFQIGKENRTVLQEYFLPPGEVHQVDVKGEGKGAALAQLTWSYYIDQTDDFMAFTLNTTLTEKDKGRMLVMKICTAFTQGNKSNMAILEANTPSGYAFDDEELDNLRRGQIFKRYELDNKDSKVNIYFDSISGEEVCLDLKAYRLYLVAKHEPGMVQIYDYYDNKQKTQVLYQVPPISLCDVCKAEEGLSCNIPECKVKQ